MAKKPFQNKGRRKEPKEFEEEVLQIDRVTRVVKGGRRLRFRATVIIGDRKNRVGVGVGKSEEVVGAIQKGIADAKKNLINVTLDGNTIPHEVKIKYKSAKILLLPAAPGTGIIAGGAVRKIVELSGIKDILSKSYGTTNKISCSRATIKALESLRETPFMKKKTAPKKPETPKKPEGAKHSGAPSQTKAEDKQAPKPQEKQEPKTSK
jgi:small subunit ribosomal protein S5